MSEKEIKSALGEPIFSRFDAVIQFCRLDKTSILKIMEKEYNKQYFILDDEEKQVINDCQINPHARDAWHHHK